MPGRRADAGARRAGAHAGDLRELGIAERALELGKRATGANMWAQGRRTARVPLGDVGRDLTPYPVHPDPRPGRQRAHPGRQAARLRHRACSGTPSWSPSSRSRMASPRRSSCRTARARTITAALGRRLRRRAQRGARAERHRVPGRALRARVLRRRHRGDGQRWCRTRSTSTSGARASTCSSRCAGTDHWRVVGILPPELRGRDDLTFEDVVPSLRSEAGAGAAFKACSWFSTYRIHHRARRALPRAPLLPARRRRAHPQPGRRAGHEHRPAGRLQPRPGSSRSSSTGRADAALLDSYEAERIPVARAAAADTTDRAFRLVVSDSWLAGLLRTEVHRADRRRFAMRVERGAAVRVPHDLADRHPLPAEPAVADAGRPARRRAARRRSLPVAAGSGSRRTARSRICSRRLDDTRFNLILIGNGAKGVPADWPIEVHEVPEVPNNFAAMARAGIRAPCYFLLRPDGYIGLAGVQLRDGDIQGYLSRFIPA